MKHSLAIQLAAAKLAAAPLSKLPRTPTAILARTLAAPITPYSRKPFSTLPASISTWKQPRRTSPIRILSASKWPASSSPILRAIPLSFRHISDRRSQLRTLPSELTLLRSPEGGGGIGPERSNEGPKKEDKVEKETLASRTARHAKEAREYEAQALANLKSSSVGSTSTADVSVSVPAAKKPLWTRVKDEAKHYYHGFRLLGLETRISTKLAFKLMRGSKLTRRESRQLKRTVADLLRLVPFLVFILVPFMEFLLPVFIKLFPNMLPSTFEDKFAEETKKKKLLKMRLQVADFLQDTIGEMGMQGKASSAKAAKEFTDFFRKIRTTGDVADAESISKVAKLFEDDITLDNLSRPQLVSMCRYMNINAFGTDNFLRFQIRNRMTKLKNDDKVIAAEGVNELTIQELQHACAARGIRTLGASPGRLRDELRQWLDLHLNHQIPSTLLILSRAFIITDRPTPTSTQEALQATLSSLPDQLVNVAELQVSEVEGAATNKQKFDVIEQQEELIADELEQEAKEEAARKEAREAEHLGRKEAREKAAMDHLLNSDQIQDEGLSMSEEQIKDIREALAVLSSKSAVDSERSRLAEIMEDREEYKEDIEELKVADRTESKASSRLGARLEKLISKIDKELEQYDTDVGSRLNIIKANEAGQVRLEEVEQALKLIRHNPNDQRIKDLVAKLDADGDGLVFIHDLKEVANDTEGFGVLVEDESVTDPIKNARESFRDEVFEDAVKGGDRSKRN